MNMTMSKYHRHSLSKQIIKHLLLTSPYSDKGEKHSSKHSCFCLLLIQLIRKQVSRKPKSDLLPKLIIATLTQHLSYIFFFEKKCLITMIDRQDPFHHFKFQVPIMVPLFRVLHYQMSRENSKCDVIIQNEYTIYKKVLIYVFL